jgi:hypothetical protein
MSEIADINREIRHWQGMFRILRGWKIGAEFSRSNFGTSISCHLSKRHWIFTWDKKNGPQPQEYVMHEVLHACECALVHMDKRSPKELKQAWEMFVQDLCRAINGGGK